MADIKTELEAFIDGLRDQVINKVLSTDLPLVGDNLQSASTGAVKFLDDMRNAIESATLPDNSAAASVIAQAITDAHIDGISASAVGGKVQIEFVKDATATVDLGAADFDFGQDFGLVSADAK